MTNANLDDQLAKLRIDKSRKRARRGSGGWVWLIILAAVGGGGWTAYQRMYAPLPVRTTRIEQETPKPGQGPALVTASGYVVPHHRVEISSKIIGRIVEAKVNRGDHVNAGDILLRIEDADYQARVVSAEAQVASLRARLAELKAGSRPQEIAAMDAAVASAQATLRNAETELKRQQSLVQQDIAAKQELDRAQASYDVAKAQVDSSKSNAQLMKIGPRQEQIDAAEAQLHEAESNLELAKTELDYTVIRAPISGTILEKLAEQGELVTNANFGGTRGAKSSVVSMADLGDLQVEVDLNESEMPKVKLHQKTEIHLDFNPQHAYTGEVEEIAPQADRQKGTIQIKVKVVDPDDLVKPEVNARVTFLGDPTGTESTTPGKTRLWVSKSAVVQRNGGSTVFVISDGKAVSKRVTVGAESEKGLEIADGLTGSETLIASPSDTLIDGTHVVPEQ